MDKVLGRSDRIQVYAVGGFLGGLLKEPVDITVDKIPDNAFERTMQIVGLLTAKEEDLNPKEIDERYKTQDCIADFGYHVNVGCQDSLQQIFNGDACRTLSIVLELETILKEYAEPEDLELKP